MTLRRVSESADAVDYEGELATDTENWPVRVRVELAAGAVEWVSGNEQAPPPWLCTFLRATLRAAWRSSLAGQPFPRRVNRWRKGDVRGAGDAEVS